MTLPPSTNINYPFSNAHKQNQEDAQSYHSITIDSKKLQYFQSPSNNLQQISNNSSAKISETNLKKKPPSYPYQEVKKLKQSLKYQNSQIKINPNHSFQSGDSFHTVGQFQSICYEEGDFQKIIHQMEQQQNSKPIQYSQSSEAKPPANNNQQKPMLTHQTHKFMNSLKSFPVKQQKINIKNDDNLFEQKIPIQQSNALNEIDIEELQNEQMSTQKYQRFEETSRLKEKGDEGQHLEQNGDEGEKEIEISHIEDALNQSELLDQQILQLTRQLQNLQSSQQLPNHSPQQSISHQPPQQQHLHKQQTLQQRYLAIQSKLQQLHSKQTSFTSQIANMHHFIQKTKSNNSYLKKEIQFFKQKSQNFQHKQKLIRQKEKLIQEKENKFQKQLQNSKHQSLRFGQQKIKPKNFHIKPKTPNNQSLQSRNYKQFTFRYCLGNKNRSSQDQWYDLEIDTQNTPPEYKLIYSFQLQNTILIVRLVDLVQKDSSRSSFGGKKPYGQSSVMRKNYQYLMDFAQNKYQTQQKKIESLSKQLIVNLDQQKYVCKQFTKKIQIFLMISEEQTFVDLVKLVPLPNPIAFFIELRFNSFHSTSHQISNPSNPVDGQKFENLNENNEGLRREQEMGNLSRLKNLSNLSKFMKTYIIKIEQMADVESIQKLMGLDWINTGSNHHPKYFTIKTQQTNQSQTRPAQLFYVKIDDCILLSSQESESLDHKHRYSLAFRVASTYDNDILIDLIEFLTFLTIY